MDSQVFGFLSRRASGISKASAEAVLAMHQEGATVPFMARYRKERTGNLDEVQIRDVIDAVEEWNEIKKRKEFVLKEISTQGNLTDELKLRIEACFDLTELEELYRPYKKKKKSKATIARDAGIGPFADWLWALGHGELKDETTLEVKAKDFINPTQGFAMYEEVLQGAQNIIVEKISNVPELRQIVRDELSLRGKVVSSKTAQFKPHSKYQMYAEFSEAVKSLGSPKATHRYLALRRGWQEGELKVSIEGDTDALLKAFENFALTTDANQAAPFLRLCAKQALMVHVIPSITNEIHAQLKENADRDAIKVFAENVRRVLMSSPFGPRVVLGVDPGIRTGCKIALIDKGGNFISHTVVQISGENAQENAKKLFEEVVRQIKIESIAVGNGTGGREAETFFRNLMKELGANVPVVMVSESGASIYSASDVAREEFPELDLTVRGAISIARRLQDPLAELVKVEPKSIGVGQYQHDVSQPKLKKSLHEVVESCVNQVGVDLNTASTSLLQYVSGIGPAIAKNIVEFRKTNGLFKERDELLKVPQFSSKVFELAAGFLRIPDGKVVLDRTGIHPERYSAIREMAQDVGLNVAQLVGEGANKLKAAREKWTKLVGDYTFDDIVKELEKPGRDPRDLFKVFQYRDDIHEVKDLKAGLICPGLVTNVTNFGAFVDIGVHQDGLVHISELSDQFVDDPRKVVNPGDQVQVRVLAVDTEKNQISLSMKLEDRPRVAAAPKPERGERPPQKRSQQRPQRSAQAGPGSAQQRPQPRGAANEKPRHSGPRGSGGGAPQKPRPEKKPFNNPFAALKGNR